MEENKAVKLSQLQWDHRVSQSKELTKRKVCKEEIQLQKKTKEHIWQEILPSHYYMKLQVKINLVCKQKRKWTEWEDLNIQQDKQSALLVK
jgi:hypothetical protein